MFEKNGDEFLDVFLEFDHFFFLFPFLGVGGVHAFL